jgi:SAM-dependent methyltransferase
MNPAQVFQTLSQTEPFFTVSSSPKYRRKQMHNENELRFWREGRDCVNEVLDCIGERSFGSVLDYGCGIGRLLRCMAPHARRAHGVDISPVLLAKASEICPDAILSHYNEWLSSAPMVEFSYSVIVFQHIPEAQGLMILARLLKYTQRVCAFHIVIADRRDWITKLLFRLSFVPPFAGLSNWLRGRSWREPRIPMFCWDLEKVKVLFGDAGFKLELFPLPNCVEGFWESYLFVGHRDIGEQPPRPAETIAPTANH